MLDNVRVFCHSSIRIESPKIIYIDPFKMNREHEDAELIFITHDHYDHFSENDIKKVMNEDSKIILPYGMYDKASNLGFKDENIIEVNPDEEKTVDGINFETIAAYNVNKEFHPRENGWVGYIITINGERYYIAGDTDVTEEARNVNCDVAFLPVGGTYTMTAEEAAELANEINPEIAVPIHYGSIVGTDEDAELFVKLLNPDIKGILLMDD